MKHIPMRSCIVCRQQKDKSELIRIVRSPDGTLEFDFDGKKSGRGAYVCKDSGCAQAAITKRLLGRAFKREISKQTYDSLQAQYEKNATNEQNAR